jgi:hypothetical protein
LQNDELVFSISKTFASGKTEKRIFEILKELGLPSGKVKFEIDFFFKFFSRKIRTMKLIQLILLSKNFVISIIKSVLVLIFRYYLMNYPVEKIILQPNNLSIG